MHVPMGEVIPVTQPREWYLLDVYPGRERTVMRWFGYYGLEGWYPLEISYVKRPNGAPARKPHLGRRVVRPFVPGLIFVPSTERSNEMLTFPYVDGFHRIGDCLARMSPSDMAVLRGIEAYLNAPREGRGKRGGHSVGDVLRVVDGPFSSFVGRVERLDSRGRLTILLDAFKRSVSVQLDDAQVEQIADTAIATGVARLRIRSLMRST